MSSQQQLPRKQSEEEEAGGQSMRGEKHKRAIRSREERCFLLLVSATVKKQAHIQGLLHLTMFSHLWHHYIQSPLPTGMMVSTVQMKKRYRWFPPSQISKANVHSDASLLHSRRWEILKHRKSLSGMFYIRRCCLCTNWGWLERKGARIKLTCNIM